MERLDNFALNIEFLLISVVQGVALAALATSAAGPRFSSKFSYTRTIDRAYGRVEDYVG